MVEKVESPCIRAHKANRQKNTNRQENKPAMTQKYDIVLLETSTLVKSCLSANTFYAWKTTTLLSVKRKHVVRKHDVTYPARWGLDINPNVFLSSMASLWLTGEPRIVKRSD